MRRSSRHAGLGATAFGVAFALLVPAGALAAPVGTLDVDQSVNQSVLRLHLGGISQVFTAGRSGDLTTVRLFLDRSADTVTAPLPVEIRDTSAAGALLATASIPASSVPLSPGAWVDVTFATGTIPSIAGHKYAIVVPQGGVNGAEYEWHCPDGGPFPAFEGAIWGGVPGTTPMTFQTYVSAAAQPTPTAAPTAAPTATPTAAPTAAATPVPTQPATDTVSPTTGRGSGTPLLVLAGLGLVACGGLALMTRRPRSRP